MELGIALPTAGPLANPANIVRVAKEAERLGYDAVWTFERLLRPVADMTHPDGSTGRLPEEYRLVYDPIETLTYVAAVTDRIKLGTSVVDALLHPPVVLARRFATLDQLSHGRAIAGLGQGWMPQEFETAGVPMMGTRSGGVRGALPPHRALRGEPQAGAGAPADPDGLHDPGRDPAGRPHRRRAHPIVMDAESLRGVAAVFRAAAEEQGRDPAALTVVGRADVPLTRAPLGADRPYLGGSPRQIADDLASLQGSGVDHVFFSTRGADIEERVGLMGELITLVRS